MFCIFAARALDCILIRTDVNGCQSPVIGKHTATSALLTWLFSTTKDISLDPSQFHETLVQATPGPYSVGVDTRTRASTLWCVVGYGHPPHHLTL